MPSQAQPTPHSDEDPFVTMHSNIEQWQAIREPRKMLQEKALRAVNNEQRFKEYIAPLVASLAPFVAMLLITIAAGVIYKACTTPQPSNTVQR